MCGALAGPALFSWGRASPSALRAFTQDTCKPEFAFEPEAGFLHARTGRILQAADRDGWRGRQKLGPGSTAGVARPRLMDHIPCQSVPVAFEARCGKSPPFGEAGSRKACDGARNLERSAMFTGIVTDMGVIEALKQEGDTRVRIGTSYDTQTIEIGASIACDGVCLTVVDLGPGWFDMQVSAETMSKTNIGARWREGARINLERALKVGDELGGHIVSGHVDGVAEIVGLREEGDSTRVTLRAPESLARFIAPKGSVALNGTSLTVNEVDGCDFGINLIPHTKAVTTWGTARVGDPVNLEIDTLARYVARLQEWS